MNIETGIPFITVFIQGLLSFFSPCILPLAPLYISYLAGGMYRTDEHGKVYYPRKKVLIHTLFFIWASVLLLSCWGLASQLSEDFSAAIRFGSLESED